MPASERIIPDGCVLLRDLPLFRPFMLLEDRAGRSRGDVYISISDRQDVFFYGQERDRLRYVVSVSDLHKKLEPLGFMTDNTLVKPVEIVEVQYKKLEKIVLDDGN